MGAIWVKAGPGLKFRVQKQLVDADTPVLVRADGNVTEKLKDGTLLKSSPPKYVEPAEEKKPPEKKQK